MKNTELKVILDWILNGSDPVNLDLARLQQEIDVESLVGIIDQLQRYPNVLQDEPVDQRLAEMLARWLSTEVADKDLEKAVFIALSELYLILNQNSLSRGYILAWMARSGNESHFVWFVDMLCKEPPSDVNALSVAFAPLMTDSKWNSEILFQRLFSDLTDSVASNLAIDVANHLFRRGHKPHPLTEYRIKLVELLNAIVDRLDTLQASTPTDREVAFANSQTVSESTAFVVSICDALGLIGDRQTINPLKHAMALEHRRIKCESAAALASMQVSEGIDQLVKLAEEPVVRKRVLAYAFEIGIVEQISDEFKSPEAIAEAELVEWLARPENFGIAPNECNLIDCRDQFWPGFEEPVRCMLFRFAFVFGDQGFESIGIGEPCAFSFKADLSAFSVEDCYQVFAGYDLDHEEVLAYQLEKAKILYRNEIDFLISRFPATGATEWIAMGIFMGEKILLGVSQEGYVAWDGNHMDVFYTDLNKKNIDWQLFWYWYVGKRLFNMFERYQDNMSN